jgi:hypothetical protein
VEVAAVADNLAMCPFLLITVPQTWVPGQRHGESSTVHQIDNQAILTDGDVLSAWFSMTEMLILTLLIGRVGRHNQPSVGARLVQQC